MGRDIKKDLDRTSSRNKHTTDSENLRGATALKGDTPKRLSVTKIKILRELVKSKRRRKGEKS